MLPDVTVDPGDARDLLPRKRMGAGALIRDPLGRVLVVEPTYQPTWELPGGAVEADESPRAACVRELEEELGLRVGLGRLLCWEWQGPEPDRTESLMFLYDGGVVADPSSLRLAVDELTSFRFVAENELAHVLEERLARRARAALDALATVTTVELENGRPV
jgi:8-oxo-dGTP diphosphatase